MNVITPPTPHNNVASYMWGSAKNVITPPHPTPMSKKQQKYAASTKRVPTTSQYYFVLQSLHKALPSTTLYYQSLHKTLHSTTLYYKACKALPVLLCTTKLAQTTSQYYFLLQS